MDSALLGVAWGLSTAAFWALADFTAKRTVEGVEPLPLTLGNQIAGAVILGIVALVLWQLAPGVWKSTFPHPATFPLDWYGWAVLAGFLAITGLSSSYQSYQVAPLAIASPIVNTKGMFAALIAVAFLGESAGIVTAAGVLACGFGAVGMGLRQRPELGGAQLFLPGVGWAVLASACYGASMAASKPIIDAAGIGVALIGIRSGAFVLLSGVVLRRRGLRRALPPRAAWPRVMALGFFDVCGHLSLLTGLSLARAVIVNPVAALTPVFTVALALLLLHERLTPRQWLAFAITGAGVFLLASAR